VQKTARFAVAHRHAGLAAEVVLGVAGDVHAVLASLVAWIGLDRRVEVHRKLLEIGRIWLAFSAIGRLAAKFRSWRDPTGARRREP
jgi:hypothetical protein